MLSMFLNNRGTSGPAGEQTGTTIFSKINRVHEQNYLTNSLKFQQNYTSNNTSNYKGKQNFNTIQNLALYVRG
jgi:hypothetical protein